MMNFKWAEPPATMAEGIGKLEALARETDAALERMSEEDFQQAHGFFRHEDDVVGGDADYAAGPRPPSRAIHNLLAHSRG